VDDDIEWLMDRLVDRMEGLVMAHSLGQPLELVISAREVERVARHVAATAEEFWLR
jgi:hypothetical protein